MNSQRRRTSGDGNGSSASSAPTPNPSQEGSGVARGAAGRPKSIPLRRGVRGGFPYLLLTLLFGLALGFVAPNSAQAQTRFVAFDVFVDSGASSLAAYQLEVRDATGVAQLVGVEGGDTGVFHSPPHYDPRALQGGRVLLAAFSTAKAAELPTGRARVATLHYQVTGEGTPRFEVKLQTAASANGRKISVTATVEERKAP